MRMRQLEILYIMARMNSIEAHKWLRDNLFQGCRVDARKKQEYKSKFGTYQRHDWKEIQVEWMKYCLMLKYKQWPRFRESLHSTPLLPVEDATSTRYASNLYWGATLVNINGANYYMGCNILGKLLKQLRDNNGELEYTLPDDMHLFGQKIITTF